MAGLTPPIVTQLAALKERYQDAHWEEVPGGGGMVRVVVPGFKLPRGWAPSEITVHFILPVGFPIARPDCFWTSEPVRLENGTTPQATGTNQMPGTSAPLFWFSWHVDSWSPDSTVMTWVKVIEKRFEQVQ